MIRKVTLKHLIDCMDPSVHDRLKALALQDGVEALVMFQNLDMCSSHLGDRAVVIVGPACTVQSVADCEGRFVGDLPSVRKYPIEWASAWELEKTYGIKGKREVPNGEPVQKDD